jgi:hypothetical protein
MAITARIKGLPAARYRGDSQFPVDSVDVNADYRIKTAL